MFVDTENVLGVNSFGDSPSPRQQAVNCAVTTISPLRLSNTYETLWTEARRYADRGAERDRFLTQIRQ